MTKGCIPKVRWALVCSVDSPLEEIKGNFFFYNHDSGDTHVLSPLAGGVVQELKKGGYQLEVSLYELTKKIASDLPYDSFRSMLNALAAREIIEISSK